MVEFALILPVMVLLLVMTIDVGRVFFGWVATTNVARAGASYASQHPDAWNLPYATSTPANKAIQDTYLLRMQQDADAINCSLPSPLPPPTFIDADGNGKTNDLNDHVKVRLTCGFTLLTPLAGSLIGNPLVIGAEAIFPIRGGLVNGAPIQTVLISPSPSPSPIATATPAPTPTPCIVPSFIGDANNLPNLRNKWQVAGFQKNNLTRTPGNWPTVLSQSKNANSDLDCQTTTILVGP